MNIFSFAISPFPKLLTQSSNSVLKSSDRKIKWIIREKMKEIPSTNDIALLQNVNGSRIRHIWRYYRTTNGRPQTNGKIERFYETFQSKYSILILWKNS